MVVAHDSSRVAATSRNDSIYPAKLGRAGQGSEEAPVEETTKPNESGATMNLGHCTHYATFEHLHRRDPDGEERCYWFDVELLKTRMVQYSFRTVAGDVFSAIGATIELCRARRDAWLDGLA